MRIVVLGGKLQGVEATYLAHQAGWEVTLIDKDILAPATGLCDKFYHLDITGDEEELARIIKGANLIIPAIEDKKVLKCLSQVAENTSIPLAFDMSAYDISASKQKSDLLFAEQDIPAPVYWPKSNFPVIVKPSDSSGSQGVRKISDSLELSSFLRTKKADKDNLIIQEFMEGPSYSLEVMGCKGKFITLQTTDLHMDKQFDCKRVLAPTSLEPGLESKFRDIGVKIAQAINLTGIMDVEVINHKGTLKVLEIDARLPSQTPTAVFKSSGINMLEHLFDIYVRGQLPDTPASLTNKAVLYEHIKVSGEGLETLGEHIMATAGPLRFRENFFGADEAITNFDGQRTSWVATLIVTGIDGKEVWEKRCAVIENIAGHCVLQVISKMENGSHPEGF